MDSLGRSVAEVARELGWDWHTVNDVVVAYGAALWTTGTASAPWTGGDSTRRCVSPE